MSIPISTQAKRPVNTENFLILNQMFSLSLRLRRCLWSLRVASLLLMMQNQNFMRDSESKSDGKQYLYITDTHIIVNETNEIQSPLPTTTTDRKTRIKLEVIMARTVSKAGLRTE
ncbi:hypothetical protein GQX74_013200 [Glossina fuscipes]|nr:hypothetical protein GQX74_013200 [Glossina fuscipes]